MGTVIAAISGRLAFVRVFWTPELHCYQVRINGLPHVEYESDTLQFAQLAALGLAHGVQANV